jgi:hypothetical protein
LDLLGRLGWLAAATARNLSVALLLLLLAVDRVLVIYATEANRHRTRVASSVEPAATVVFAVEVFVTRRLMRIVAAAAYRRH